ncbi:MAG: helix-turn-helix transcriptional regulator [Spirochaetes bacterium]|nr:helix-turn-helix transcriptional regulator [Spirochaetota bacterium]
MSPIIRYNDPRGRYAYRHYHFPDGTNAVNNIIHLVRVENHKASDAVPAHRNNGSEIELHYIAEGSQRYTVGGRHYSLNAGDILTVRPNETHHGGLFEEKRTGYYLFIDIKSHRGDFLGYSVPAERLRKAVAAFPRLFSAPRSAQRDFDRILDVYENRTLLPAFRKLKLQTLFMDLLLSLAENARSSRKKSGTPHIIAAQHFIEAHIREPLTVKDIARHAKLSVSVLGHRFKHETGVSPKDYLLRRRVEAAMYLLRDGPMNVTDIAYELHFSSSQHFATTFKALCNRTPMQYRTEHRRRRRT